MAESFQDPSLYINRELSWLEFNSRVLHEALDGRNPLLERLRFLAIFSTNMDEFYMVRVARLRRQVAEELHVETPDGLTAMEQLEEIAEREAALRRLQMRCLHQELLPLLAEQGIEILAMDDLTHEEQERAEDFFTRHVLPILTPLGIDTRRVVPHISNLALSLAVRLRDPQSRTKHFAIMEVPKTLPRWVRLGESHRYVPLERLIGDHLDALFPGFEVVSWCPFRLTRDAEMEEANWEKREDPLTAMEEQVFRRRFGEVSRLEVPSQIPRDIRAVLLAEMCDESLPPCVTMREKYVHEAESLLQLGDMSQLASLDIPELRFPPARPSTPHIFRGERRSIFAIVRETDVLVHHPFDSFATTVEEFIQEAAADENVLAIKLTLYRTSNDTAILRALADAAERGTQVVVVVELKARFDETNNISWARTLENAGVHTVFGIGPLKTHAKLALVVRRDTDGMRRYVHIGTGNYNTITARSYTDLGLLTCNPVIGEDVSSLFNHLTGFTRKAAYRDLLVAPDSLRDRLFSLIEREAEHARAGNPARIIAKMNSISDADTIAALYEASSAGVEIDLIVRGICCLRPGVPGVSERIRVVSIIGRFLEHSRVWHFANGGDAEYYIGSADWMPRNLDRRIEAVVPVREAALTQRLHTLLDTYLNDDRQAWDLNSDGSYTQRMPANGDVNASHVRLVEHPWGAPTDDARRGESFWRTAIEVLRREPAPSGPQTRRPGRALEMIP